MCQSMTPQSRSTSPRSKDGVPRLNGDGLLLEVAQVTKCYGGNTVVEDLSFVVPPGRVASHILAEAGATT